MCTLDCGFNDDERRTNWRADECEPGPVEDEGLAGMNDDVVRIM